MTIERPLSPHLQIYKPQITSTLSIMNRGTGIALTFGLFALAWWLLAAATGPDAYDFFRKCILHPVGIVCMVGWSFSLFYHTCAGIRHLVLDTGKWFTIPEIYKSGYTMLACSVLLTAAFWAAILFA